VKCPADKLAWRQTKAGPMPLLVPAEQLEAWHKRNPELWIEAMPAHIQLDGRTLMPRDLRPPEEGCS
jgi:hypothetical protein